MLAVNVAEEGSRALNAGFRILIVQGVNISMPEHDKLWLVSLREPMLLGHLSHLFYSLKLNSVISSHFCERRPLPFYNCVYGPSYGSQARSCVMLPYFIRSFTN